MLKIGDKVKILHKTHLNHGNVPKWANVDTFDKIGIVDNEVSNSNHDVTVYIDGVYSGWYEQPHLQLIARDGVEVGKTYKEVDRCWNTKVSHLIFDNDELFVVSRDDDDDEMRIETFQDFKRGYIIESSDVTEVTLEQIAEKMGVSVEKLRIKE